VGDSDDLGKLESAQGLLDTIKGEEGVGDTNNNTPGGEREQQ